MLGVAAYLRETGDTSVLGEPVPYGNAAASTTSLYEHLQRSLRYTLDRLGPHGLPLIGRDDWNDCLNLNCFSASPEESFQTAANKTGGAAESVFIAALFIVASRELADIAQRRNLPGDAAAYPALPASWPGFTAIRRSRGAAYDIRVTNRTPGGRIRDLVVNGQRTNGTVVPLAPPGATVTVEAR